MTNALGISHVSKTFGSSLALDDMRLDIESGEIRALVGENGSGKSTLIKILSGYHLPDAGAEVLVQGKPLRFGSPDESLRAGLRFVHQDLGLVNDMTALENIGIVSGFPHRLGMIDWRTHRARVSGLLERIGVRLDVDVPVSRLTAVERTAVAIARCLDSVDGEDPVVLVLDEPTAALPQHDVDRLFTIVRDVAARGVAVLYVSHRLEEVLAFCHRITAIRDGRLVATVDSKGLDRAALTQLIVGHDVELSSAVRRGADLGDVRLAVDSLSCQTLEPTSFAVRAKEIVGFAGLDGSGREAIARALVGDGDVEMNWITVGEDRCSSMSPAIANTLGIALVLANRDEAAAVRGMSIRENVTLADLDAVSRAGVIDAGAERAAARSWIKALDIRPAEPEQEYGSLSGGNRQKVILAKWISIEPRVLVLDDPTSGVDVGARAGMYEQIRELADRGVAVVVASSDVEDLVHLCDRVHVLVHGRISAELSGPALTEQALTFAMSDIKLREAEGA